MSKQFNGKVVGNYVMYTGERNRGSSTAIYYPGTTFALGNGGGSVVSLGGTNNSTTSHGPVAMFDGTIVRATLGIFQSTPTTFTSGRFALRYFYGGGNITETANNRVFDLGGLSNGDTIVKSPNVNISAGWSFNFICTEATGPTQSDFTLSLSILVRYDIPYQNEQGYLL